MLDSHTHTHTDIETQRQIDRERVRWLNFIMFWQDIPITYWGYILSVLCSEKIICIFFSASVKYQRRAPAEQRIDRAGRGMNFSAAFALPFSLFLSFPVGSVDTLCGREAQAACELAELHPRNSSSFGRTGYLNTKIESRCVNTVLASVYDYRWQQM